MEEKKFKYPTEQIELPSKGLLYPESSLLSKGAIENGNKNENSFLPGVYKDSSNGKASIVVKSYQIN